MITDVVAIEVEETTVQVNNDQYWVNLARYAHSSSSTWFDTNVRNRVINDIRQFQGEHPEGSKYYTDTYKLKSHMFRPKTRTAIRKCEATAAGAYFSTEDVVAIRPVDDDDPVHVAAAAIHKSLLQYRLTRPYPAGLPWFLTLMGAVQEALTVGVVASFQEWKRLPHKGLDRPDVTLLPIENYRFDPAADWRDVVNSSPYFIVKWPMYVKDVKARMQEPAAVEEEEQEAGEVEATEQEGKKPWRYYSESQIRSATQTSDTIRMTREKGTDTKTAEQGLSEFAIAWVHENFVEVDGVDVVYYTLGTEYLLSDPVRVTDKYPQGRPVVVGFSILEAHKAYKSSLGTITRDIQGEINDVANLRIDNVKLILNKRHIVRRGAQVDLRSLTRNIPGSVTLANDPNGDVRFVTTDDATASSYQEQDRLNLDFDDMAGAFSGSSVASNRKLNETVGGMELLSGNADAVTEYQLRTITVTWVEQVLRQLIVLEQAYENDELVLALVGKNAGLDKLGFALDDIDRLIMQDTILNVGVGVGAVNPQKQIERFVYGIKSVNEMLPGVADKLKHEEVIKELFGKLGYKDGMRFFDIGDDQQQDPRLQQAMEQIQQLQQALAMKNPPEVVAAQVAKLESETALNDVRAMVQRVEALYASMNTAQTAVQVPGVTPVADAIAKSAGFVDQDAAPIYPANVQQQQIPVEAQIPQNTSPMFPANAGGGMMDGIEAGAAPAVQYDGGQGEMQ